MAILIYSFNEAEAFTPRIDTNLGYTPGTLARASMRPRLLHLG